MADRLAPLTKALTWLTPTGFNDTSDEELWRVLIKLTECREYVEAEMRRRKSTKEITP